MEEKLWYDITTRGHGKKLIDKKFWAHFRAFIEHREAKYLEVCGKDLHKELHELYY